MVNWNERLRLAVQRAAVPEPIEPSRPVVIAVPRPMTDDEVAHARRELDALLAEVAMMAAPLLSWLPQRRPRWNPEGFVHTMLVLELTDGMVRSE